LAEVGVALASGFLSVPRLEVSAARAFVALDFSRN
jgi:hypothetical protein